MSSQGIHRHHIRTQANHLSGLPSRWPLTLDSCSTLVNKTTLALSSQPYTHLAVLLQDQSISHIQRPLPHCLHMIGKWSRKKLYVMKQIRSFTPTPQMLQTGRADTSGADLPPGTGVPQCVPAPCREVPGPHEVHPPCTFPGPSAARPAGPGGLDSRCTAAVLRGGALAA